jgi:Niemann-Pick C1 protein
MFVVMAGIKKYKQLYSDMPINQQIAMTMKNAGTSITITSVTDILVFLVGISTDIPFLKSYCVYAALNIFMIYVYVITFFVAVLALDERRIKARKNAIIPCIVHSDKATRPCIEVNWLEQLLEFVYSKCILTKLGKVRQQRKHQFKKNSC